MPSTDWRLGLRTIYIVPSRFGVLWLASAALLVLVAIQTGSNSTLLLAFLLLGVMALAMVLTHDNLDGVTLRCATPRPRICPGAAAVSRAGGLPHSAPTGAIAF